MQAFLCRSKMFRQFVFTVLICNAVITNFVAARLDEYKYEDLSLSSKADVLDLLRTYVTKYKENRRAADDDVSEIWTGRWMPDRLGDPAPMPKIFPKNASVNRNLDVTNPPRQVQMGVNEGCDDGKKNLTVDWDYSPVNYTCFSRRIRPSYGIKPLIYNDRIPPAYVALHRCMNETIEYSDTVPTYGTHRPVWPVYGEYKFIPKQRWLHAMEHGSVVMLYHPCANPLEVKLLKSLVTGCIRRHIISPYNLLDEKRPLALVVWGSRLTMSYVNPTIVRRFIQNRALRGPEQLSKDGGFQEDLLHKAKIVSDMDDTELCPAL